MKLFILVDDPTCYGGIQQFSRNLARDLGEKLEVSLLAYFGVLSHYKECPYPVIRLNQAESRHGLERLIRGSAEAYQRPCGRRSIALLQDMPAIRRRLATTVGEGNILLVNSFHSLHLFVSSSVMARNRVIFVQHSSPDQLWRWRYDFGGWLRPCKIALFNRWVDALVTLSPYERRHFERYLALDGKIVRDIRHQTVLPPVAELTSERTRNVMFLGRLTREKRVDRILEVARAAPDFHFNLYGDGPEEPALRRAAAGLGNVSFHGYIDGPAQAMRENAIAIFTSDMEGYPIAGIECVANGKPLLVLDRFPAAADLVRDDRNGLLLEEFNPEAFAAALRELYERYDFYRGNTLCARLKYEPATIREKWSGLIDDLSAHGVKPIR